ncbi:alpha/beta fold hydrolase [Emticicia agri]|uniref:Alpha/beta fold hydrolase n=1 Tax=Emticicia agri TaxID=2492393 RepID=A0A4Q5M3E3_9BACT|nr:alpha/beta fold hydrolase [Emticicia agri]RYU96896.1 alpha/beta fold hydrolase [Emticicia agri]
MKKFLFFFSLCTTQIFAQNTLKFASIGQFKTQGSKIIKNCKLGYRTFGQLNAEKSNAILFPTWFGGTSENLIANAGTMIDTTKFYLILVDALGNGISSSPSNTPGFPDITIRDMVNAEYTLITKNFQLNHLYAVMGISMGGMQTFEWITAYPDFVEKAIPIVGTPKQSYYDILLWKTEWNIIEQAGKNPVARKNAMRQVATVHNLNLATPDYYVRTEKAEEAYAKMQKSGEDRVKGNNPENWICQIKAMLSQDIYQTSGKSLSEMPNHIKAKLLVIVATRDAMVNPYTATEFAKALNTNYVELTGDCGHLAPGCETDKVKKAIAAFL